MIAGTWGIFNVLAATFITPFAGAIQPIALPLPQDIQYAQYITAQLAQNQFSTDPRVERVAGQVAQALNQAGGNEPEAILEAFIINPRVCTTQADNLSYRLVVRNVGEIAAQEITVQFSHPPGTSFVFSEPLPNRELDQNLLHEWFVDALAPGPPFIDYSVILRVDPVIQNVTTQLTVFYTDPSKQGEARNKKVVAQHRIDGPCDTYPGEFTPLPSAQPAIVCHPDEKDCVNTYNTLPLGQPYQNALRAEQQPRICSRNDPGACAPNKPQLGVRFAEAIADIQPGECRVLEDDIIVEPEFHDALNRQADPSALFMAPLYQAGQDFRQMLLQNELLGIQNLGDTRQTLRLMLDAHWRNHIDIVRKLVDDPVRYLGSALADYDHQTATWTSDLSSLQFGRTQAYEALQEQRKEKFDPVGKQAVLHAKESIRRSCAIDSDGGLEGLLVGVKTQYEQALQQRLGTYAQPQQDSLQIYSATIPKWRAALDAAINAYQGGNKESLKKHLVLVQSAQYQDVFTSLMAPYEQHDAADEASDAAVHRTGWEVALDTPKRVATDCEKELVFAPRIETTWCESGNAPEFIIKGAPQPVKDVKPPESIDEDPDTEIRRLNITNVSCGGAPGDPWWAADCSCNCNDLIPNLADGNIKFCQAAGGQKAITRHDIFVTHQLECFADDAKRANHQDPFF